MPRAFLFVLNSFGIGGAPDAAAFGDDGANTFGHIAEACAAGVADRTGLRHGRLHLPHLASLGLGEAARLASGRQATGFPLPDQLRPGAFWGAAEEISSGKDTPSGHWEIAGVPVRFDWGYFPMTATGLSGRAHRGADARGRAARHPRQLPCVGDGDHRRARRGAHPDRQADLLHLRRFRLQIAAHEAHFGLDGSTNSAGSSAGSSIRSISAG